MERFSAVGCHVFAGGFTAGVKKVFDVEHQLEVHDLGHRTTQEVWGVPVIHGPTTSWPQRRGQAMLYGNPRCTGFSCVTAGYGSDAHGPWAKQCQDINDLMEYGLSNEFPVIVWESVQQAFSTGKPLLDLWTERVAAKGYRVAHVLANAATFGNAQNRRRYFYVAYPGHLQFNVDLPEISPYYPVIGDILWERRHRDTKSFGWKDEEYDQDCYIDLTEDERYSISKLPSGWCLNEVGRFAPEHLSERYQEVWRLRNSDMPFSMHCIYRTNWLRPCPTLTSTSVRLIHPWHHRPFTIGELADIMGWEGKIPVGPMPSYQIAKGVCPAVGEWIAQQVDKCLRDQWGGEEWSCKYDHREGKFVGEDSKGKIEKVIDVTHYVGHMFDLARYPEEMTRQHHKFNIDPMTGKLIKPWKLKTA